LKLAALAALAVEARVGSVLAVERVDAKAAVEGVVAGEAVAVAVNRPLGPRR
jgi:hypothetical protein